LTSPGDCTTVVIPDPAIIPGGLSLGFHSTLLSTNHRLRLFENRQVGR
jgi:hypothetical protein